MMLDFIKHYMIEIAVILCVIAFLSFVVIQGSKMSLEFRERCEQQGGIVVHQSGSPKICVKADALIDMDQ